MMRSLYAGVSGLQNHQVRMDVIGNNISNVNTIGFKKGRVNFQDMLSQTMAGAARPTDEVGGVNPKQVGLGMTVASIDTIHTQGSLQTTGVMTDIAVQGNGFFVLRSGASRSGSERSVRHQHYRHRRCSEHYPSGSGQPVHVQPGHTRLDARVRGAVPRLGFQYLLWTGQFRVGHQPCSRSGRRRVTRGRIGCLRFRHAGELG